MLGGWGEVSEEVVAEREGSDEWLWEGSVMKKVLDISVLILLHRCKKRSRTSQRPSVLQTMMSSLLALKVFGWVFLGEYIAACRWS